MYFAVIVQIYLFHMIIIIHGLINIPSEVDVDPSITVMPFFS